SIVVNYAVAELMIHQAGMGHAGLALSTSAVALFGFVVQFAILRGRIGGVYGRSLVSHISKVALAAAAMAIVILLSSRAMEMWLGVSKVARLADLCVSIPLGLCAYYLGCRALHLPDLDAVIKAFTNPIRRRMRRVS